MQSEPAERSRSWTPQGELGRQSGGDTGLGQAFDQQEDIGRAAARHRRHRIDQRLVLDPSDLAHGGEQAVAQAALGGGNMGIRAGDGDAAPDRGRGVRHGAHDGGIRSQMALEIADRLAGRDRQDDGTRPSEAPIVRRHLVHHLRLDREDDDFGSEIGREGFGVEVVRNAGAAGETGGAGTRLDHGRVAHYSAGEPALEHGAPHLAAANEKDLADRPGGCLGSRFRLAHASPTGSIIAAVMASSADLPPHNTS